MNCPIAHVMNMFGSVLKKPTTTTAATTTLSVPYIKLNDTNIYIYITLKMDRVQVAYNNH